MGQAGKLILVQRFRQVTEQGQAAFQCLGLQCEQFCFGEPAEQDGAGDKASTAGDFNQFNPWQVWQALVAQDDVERRFGQGHQADRLLGVFGRGQSLETEAPEQALGGEQLKGMVLHQQDAKGVTGHRRHTVSQASMEGM